MTASIFLDRDGVINELVEDPETGFMESPLDPKDVVLLPGVVGALSRLRGAGYLLIGVSNQPAAAKGRVSLGELREVQSRVIDLLAANGIRFDSFQLCFHHPDGSVPALAIRCRCRKPAPGMILDSAAVLGVDLERSWLVGDTDGDVAAGNAAGIRTILVRHPGSEHKRRGSATPDASAGDLGAAVDVILNRRAG